MMGEGASCKDPRRLRDSGTKENSGKGTPKQSGVRPVGCGGVVGKVVGRQ